MQPIDIIVTGHQPFSKSVWSLSPTNRRVRP